MRTFVILRTDYPMEIHAAGCADLKGRKARRYDQDWTATGENIAEVVKQQAADLNHDFDHEYPADQLFRVMPCCHREAV